MRERADRVWSLPLLLQLLLDRPIFADLDISTRIRLHKTLMCIFVVMEDNRLEVKVNNKEELGILNNTTQLVLSPLENQAGRTLRKNPDWQVPRRLPRERERGGTKD